MLLDGDYVYITSMNHGEFSDRYAKIIKPLNPVTNLIEVETSTGKYILDETFYTDIKPHHIVSMGKLVSIDEGENFGIIEFFDTDVKGYMIKRSGTDQLTEKEGALKSSFFCFMMNAKM